VFQDNTLYKLTYLLTYLCVRYAVQDAEFLRECSVEVVVDGQTKSLLNDTHESNGVVVTDTF